MPRLRQVSRAEVKDPTVLQWYERLFQDRDPVAQPGTHTGTPGDWWTVFALVPDILDHATRGFAMYMSDKRKLPASLRELGQTRAGWLTASQFVYSQHCKSCRAAGIAEDKIAAIQAWEVADCFDEKERALLAYTDYLVGQRGRVPDAVFAKLKSFFSDEEIFEFTYTTAMYDMHAVITKALRMEFDNREDPIVEIAAPEAGKGRTFLDSE